MDLDRRRARRRRRAPRRRPATAASSTVALHPAGQAQRHLLRDVARVRPADAAAGRRTTTSTSSWCAARRAGRSPPAPTSRSSRRCAPTPTARAATARRSTAGEQALIALPQADGRAHRGLRDRRRQPGRARLRPARVRDAARASASRRPSSASSTRSARPRAWSRRSGRRGRAGSCSPATWSTPRPPCASAWCTRSSRPAPSRSGRTRWPRTLASRARVSLTGGKLLVAKAAPRPARGGRRGARRLRAVLDQRGVRRGRRRLPRQARARLPRRPVSRGGRRRRSASRRSTTSSTTRRGRWPTRPEVVPDGARGCSARRRRARSRPASSRSRRRCCTSLARGARRAGPAARGRRRGGPRARLPGARRRPRTRRPPGATSELTADAALRRDRRPLRPARAAAAHHRHPRARRHPRPRARRPGARPAAARPRRAARPVGQLAVLGGRRHRLRELPHAAGSPASRSPARRSCCGTRAAYDALVADLVATGMVERRQPPLLGRPPVDPLPDARGAHRRHDAAARRRRPARRRWSRSLVRAAAAEALQRGEPVPDAAARAGPRRPLARRPVRRSRASWSTLRAGGAAAGRRGGRARCSTGCATTSRTPATGTRCSALAEQAAGPRHVAPPAAPDVRPDRRPHRGHAADSSRRSCRVAG